MKVITKLEDITRYLKNKDQEEIQKILIVNNGLIFDQDNKLRTFFNFISKVPPQVNDIQIQIENVQNHSDSLLEDFKQLLKLNFQNLQLQIDVNNFVQNSQVDIYNEILQFAAEIIQTCKFYRLKFNIENELKIDINQCTASIKYKQTRQIRQQDMIDGFSKLLSALKQDIKIFSLKFILSNIRLSHLQKNQFIKSLEDFKVVHNQKLKIYLNDKQETDYKNLLKNNKLLQKGKYTYDIPNCNILLVSSNLSDSVKNLQIFKEKQLILQKQEQSLILNLNSYFLKFTKDLEYSLNSWNLYKLVEVILTIDDIILQVNVATAIKTFIQKQNFIKNLTLIYKHTKFLNQSQDILVIIHAINKLYQLEKLKIEFSTLNSLDLQIQESFFTSPLLNLKHIDICFQYQCIKLSKFLSFMRLTPNVESVLIYFSNKGRYFFDEKIELKNEQLNICLSDLSNDLFDYFNEENFDLKKQVSLNLKLFNSQFTPQAIVHANKLDSFSTKLIEIKLFFEVDSLCFEFKLNAEIKRQRPFSIQVKNTKIFEKQEFKQIFIKIDDTFIKYLKQLYPELIIIQDEVNHQNGQIYNIDSHDDSQQVNLINAYQQLIIIDQSQMDQQVVQDSQIPGNGENLSLVQDFQDDLNQKNEQFSFNKKQKQQQKKINNIQKQQDFQCPKQFESFFEFIEFFQVYEQCSLDFSSVYSEQFLDTLFEKLYLLRKIKKIDLNISKNQLNSKWLKKWKSFFNSLNKAESIALNFSENYQICNQSALYAFNCLNKCRVNLLELKIDLSQTSVKQRGLLSLSKKIAKLNQLRIFSLNISNSYNMNVLKNSFIQQLFVSLNSKNLPNLEELYLKACNAQLMLDQNFYNILATNIPLLSQNLKVFKLNFKNNITLSNICQNTFLISISKLPKDLVSISLHFQQIEDYTEAQLFSFMKIAQTLKSFEKLEKITIKSNKHTQDTMIITNLPDLYKLLRGIINGQSSITINLVYQLFDQKSFIEFLKKASKIPSKIKYLEFIMQDNQYKDNYTPNELDFYNFNIKQSSLLGLRLDFKNVFLDQNKKQRQIKLLVKIGKDFLENKFEIQELSHLELIAQKGFQFVLKCNQLILHYSENLTQENLSVLHDMNCMIQKWPHKFEYIEIKIVDKQQNIIQSQTVFELLSFIPKQTKAQVIKLDIKAQLNFINNDSIERCFYNFNRKDIQQFSYSIVGYQSFKFLNQLKDFNSNISYAFLFFQQDNQSLEVQILRKKLEVKANISDLEQNQTLSNNIKTWRLERIESLQIADQNITVFQSFLQNKYFTKLQDLTLDISYNIDQSSDLNIQLQSLATLKKINLKVYYTQQKQLLNFCDMIAQIKKLEVLCIDMKMVEICDKQFFEMFSEKLQGISQSLLTFSLRFHLVNNPFQYNETGIIQLFIPFFSQLSQIQNFKFSSYIKDYILLEKDTLNLHLQSEKTSELVEYLRYFQQDKLLNEILEKININIINQDRVEGGDDIMKALITNLNSKIQQLEVQINTHAKQNSYFNYDFELKSNLQLKLIFNDRLIIDHNQSYTEINYYHQDISQIQDNIEAIQVGESKENQKIKQIADESAQLDNKIDEISEDASERSIIEKTKVNIPNQKKQHDIYKKLFQLFVHQKNEAIIFCNFSEQEFLKGLQENFPQSQKVTLQMCNVELSRDEIPVLRNIIQNCTSKEFNFNVSQNNLHNQESIALFSKLQKQKKRFNKISINLSETQIRLKGIKDLVNKLSKFKKLKHLELDISSSKTSYFLNSSLINNIFQAASHKNMPDLVNLTLCAQFSHVQIDQLFFNSLQNYLQEASSTLKRLHLDFSSNYISKDIKITNFLTNFHENLTYFYLNLSNKCPLQQPYLNSMIKDLIKSLKRISINNLSIILPEYLIGKYSESYFWQVLKLFLQLLKNESQNIQIGTVNFSFDKKERMIKNFSFKNLISDINGIDIQNQKKLLIQFCSLTLNQLPIDFKIENQLQQLY
ncbi:hypothetical protein ABPG72_008364 [Tetrahymena utriculariae]